MEIRSQTTRYFTPITIIVGPNHTPNLFYSVIFRKSCHRPVIIQSYLIVVLLLVVV